MGVGFEYYLLTAFGVLVMFVGRVVDWLRVQLLLSVRRQRVPPEVVLGEADAVTYREPTHHPLFDIHDQNPTERVVQES